MESVTSKPSSVMPGIGAAVSVIVHSTAPTVAEASAKPQTPRQTRVTQHKVCSEFIHRFGFYPVEPQQTEQTSATTSKSDSKC